mgnify:CR=1 FL=1
MRVLLIGANGRMGKEMQNYMTLKKIDFVGIDKFNTDTEKYVRFDVVVDFSSSEALEQNLNIALSHSSPIVVATTNHSKENEKLLKTYSKNIPILYSSNLSLGMNYFIKVIKQIKKLACYEFVLEETHHKNKKDKPSGTCKTLIKNLNKQGIKPQVFCLRVGNVFGIHTLKVFGENENLTITHNVLSRQVFCEGAICACKFLLNKKKGLYSMENVIDSL